VDDPVDSLIIDVDQHQGQAGEVKKGQAAQRMNFDLYTWSGLSN